ncbi:MAG: NAD(P)/FAD-dependent oxidoreductase [Planctomycetes bacterium]|nr:NAD(P)/FAD-dependent oxidoreductase [Planctomycetota bacterium]
MTLERADVVIAGAGPAGSVLAALVARPARRVVLLHRPGAGSGVLAETVVGSAAPLFERLGLVDVVGRLGFQGAARHGAIWGAGDLAWRRLASAERGYKLEREAFDSALRERARAGGVEIVEDASARAPWGAPRVRADRERARSAVDELARGAPGEAELAFDARVVVAAAGRTMPETLVDARVVAELPATIALNARVPDAGELADATSIEAVPEGWWWWIPLQRGGASVTLFVDRGELGARGRDALWRSAREHARGPCRGAPAAFERGTTAAPRLVETRADVLLVGDAASCVDPLSSQGVEKALASAEHAARCVNALLEGKLARAEVLAHRRAWERGLFEAHARSTLAFYAAERRFEGAPFWAKRHALAKTAAAARALPMPERVRPNPELEPAHVLVPSGDALAALPGQRVRGNDDAHAEFHGAPVDALLACCAGGVAFDEFLARARLDPALCTRSPSVVREALVSALRARVVSAC